MMSTYYVPNVTYLYIYNIIAYLHLLRAMAAVVGCGKKKTNVYRGYRRVQNHRHKCAEGLKFFVGRIIG